MKKGKKILYSVLASAVLLTGGGTVYAADSNLKTEIDWDRSWENVDNGQYLTESINFGTSGTGGGDFSTQAWGDLATGKTALSSGSGNITSTGTTQGKIFGATVTAQTSIRHSSLGYITGPKKTATLKFTATSKATVKNPYGTQSFEGLTVHGASDGIGVYSVRTYSSGSY